MQFIYIHHFWQTCVNISVPLSHDSSCFLLSTLWISTLFLLLLIKSFSVIDSTHINQPLNNEVVSQSFHRCSLFGSFLHQVSISHSMQAWATALWSHAERRTRTKPDFHQWAAVSLLWQKLNLVIKICVLAFKMQTHSPLVSSLI